MTAFRYKLTPKLPDYPGSKRTYPRFHRVENTPANELQKTRALSRETSEELAFSVRLLQSFGNNKFIRRMQVRQLSSVVDSFFGILNYHSLAKESRGELDISAKDHKRIEGRRGILESYKASIKLFARAMGVQNPNEDELQMRGPEKHWIALRNRIIHPRSLEEYEINGCDLAVLAATGEWFIKVSDWSLQLELKQIDDVQKTINTRMDSLRSMIMRDLEKKS